MNATRPAPPTTATRDAADEAAAYARGYADAIADMLARTPPQADDTLPVGCPPGHEHRRFVIVRTND